MAGTFVVNGDGTITVAFEYTGEAQKVQDTAENAAENLYGMSFGHVFDVDEVLVPFEDLTSQQKLDILDAWLLKDARDLAAENIDKKDVIAAKAAARVKAQEQLL